MEGKLRGDVGFNENEHSVGKNGSSLLIVADSVLSCPFLVEEPAKKVRRDLLEAYHIWIEVGADLQAMKILDERTSIHQTHLAYRLPPILVCVEIEPYVPTK